MKVMTVFGTRPEAIKMCPIVKVLAGDDSIQNVLVLSGQHREMLQQVMSTFHVKEQYNLNIMEPQQTLSGMTTKIICGLDQIVQVEKPDLILVHGDTTTSFAAALVCFYNHIPIGHVEAGLRTNDFAAPFPEEFNRQVVDLISDLYFAPTKQSAENLIREGKDKNKIWITGNTVIDALKTTVDDAYINDDIVWAKGSKLILMTAHRRENIGDSMRKMFTAIRRIVEDYDDVKVIYPMHLNPVVREIAMKELGEMDRVRLIEPLDVFDFHNYMNQSYLILTDSGGIQEEAPALGKPVLVMRNTTERPEGVEAGTLRLVGNTEEQIYSELKRLLDSDIEYDKMSRAANPYGDGFASERIVKIIKMWGEQKQLV